MRIQIMVDNLLEIAQILALENVCNNFLRKMLILSARSFKRIRGMPPAPAIFYILKDQLLRRDRERNPCIVFLPSHFSRPLLLNFKAKEICQTDAPHLLKD